MDFLPNFPESTDSGSTGMLIIVDSFTNMENYIHIRQDGDSTELAQRFFKYVICKCGVPANITANSSKQFTS